MTTATRTFCAPGRGARRPAGRPLPGGGAVARPDGTVDVVEGVCEGRVARVLRGRGGFGYDPLFVATADGRTMAELSFDEKNQISHRARALRAAEPHLRAALAAARKEPRALDANTTTGPRRAGGSTDDPHVGGRA